MKQWSQAHVFLGYDINISLNPKVVEQTIIQGFRTETIEITGLEGERIPFRIIYPKTKVQSEEKVPVVVFLYGIGQNMHFFSEIAPLFAERGFAMVMPEQYGMGVRKNRKYFLNKIFDLWQRSSRIVPETRRTVDFLSTVPGIDSGRITLMGASYGGIMGCAVLAKEQRFSNGILIMAGGNLPEILSGLATQYRPKWKHFMMPVTHFIAWWFSPFEPLHFVSRVTPRPLLFLTLKYDDLIPGKSSDRLYEAAGEAKTCILYEGSHSHISRELVVQMIDDALLWLERQSGTF